LSSLEEARRLNDELERTKRNLASIKAEASEVNQLFYRTSDLLRRLGLPQNVDKAISEVMRMIALARTLQTSITALQVAMLPGAGPLGVAAALIGLGATFLSLSMELECPRY